MLPTGCGTAEPGGASATSAAATEGHAFTHIHGVGIDPADGKVLLATHGGLLKVGDGGEIEQVGPVIDLMGFAVSGPGHFLASGHPGPGVDLPQPVGLIESTNGGRTWEPLSRQGQSDFHALAVSQAGVLGYDGTLLGSADGRQWQARAIPAAPASLAMSPDGGTVLATTQQGLLRSADSGSSWSAVQGAPLLQVLDWAEDGATVAAVDPAGVTWTSADGGTWVQGGHVGGAPQAVAVQPDDDALRVVVATTAAVLESRDGGRTFEVLLQL